MKTLVMTGGGTGGHIIPNLALIPTLKKHFKIYYLGEKGSLEEELISKIQGVEFIPIRAVKFARKLSPKNLLIPFKLLTYINETKKILKKIKPNIIFAKGGYVSIPVAFAGHSLKIPILAHESDFTMGLANKLILKKSKVMFTSFRETCVGNKCLYSGNPIREEIFSGNKLIARKNCKFITDKKVLMFFGGSMGSKTINDFVFENLKHLKDYNIIHFVGKNKGKDIKADNYFQIEYASNIYDYFALADVVICRAGANSIFELLALKKLMLLIPLSKAESRGDQIENANVFKKNGFAQVLEEEELSLDNFLKKINNIFKNSDFYIKNMENEGKNTANDLICDYLLDYSR